MKTAARYLCSSILFLLCATASAQEQEIKFNVTRFEIQGENPLGMQAYTLLKPFIGPAQTLSSLQQARQTLQNKLIDQGFSFYKVLLPPQETDGVIQFRIAPFVIGTITVEGANFFSKQNILNSLPPLKSDIAPNLNVLSKAVTVANQNPAKQIKLNFKQGEEASHIDSIDVTVKTADKRPRSIMFALDNSGTGDNGRARAYFSAQHANLFDRDHVFAVSTATAVQAPNRVKQIGMSYQIPLYGLSSVVRANYAYSSVQSGVLGDGLIIRGSGNISGINFTHFLTPSDFYQSDIQAGIENKKFFAIKLDEFTLTPDIVSRPLTLSYHGRYQAARQLIEGQIDWVRNISGGNDNNDKTYQENRYGASSNWQAWRVSGNLIQNLPKNWAFVTRVSGQYATQPLIAGEQFGVGGNTFLRGIEERAVAGDSGIALAFEAWSSPLLTNLVNNLRLIGFIDMAQIHRRIPLNQSADVFLASAGTGIRWNINTRTTFNADYGRVLNGEAIENGSTNTGHQRVYFSIAYRF